VLRLPQTLMHPQAQACLQELQAGIATSASPIVVDASALTAFDSCALAVLLELRRSTALAGKDLRLKGLPEQLKVLAVETYKSQFTQIINTKGIDGLIESLVARNKTNTSAKKG